MDDIFGITPIDAALSAYGLNISQALMEFMFHQSSVGACVLMLGFVVSIVKTIRLSNLYPVIYSFFLYIAVVFLIVNPSYDQTSIKSLLENNSNQSSPSALSIKSSQTSLHSAPVMLSFVGQGFDHLLYLMINAFSLGTPDAVHFLKHPFEFQEQSLLSYGIVRQTKIELVLKQQLDDFIHTAYLPALVMLKNDSNRVDKLSTLGPQHDLIRKYLSQAEHNQWAQFKTDLVQHLKTSHDWDLKRSLILNIDQTHAQNIDDDFITRIIQARAFEATPHSSFILFWKGVGGFLKAIPLVYGIAQLCLYSAFPFFLLTYLVIQNMQICLAYAKLFIWIKTWVLMFALAYYASIFVARFQAQSAPNASWFWNTPYASLVCVVCSFALPVVMFFIIHQATLSLNTKGVV